MNTKRADRQNDTPRLTEEENTCRLGMCYRGLAFSLPVSLVLWVGLVALFYKVFA